MTKISAEPKKIAGLDGFRFLAFTLVLLCHTLPKSSPENSDFVNIMLNSFQLNGIIGMQFFFFLSAFLLSYLSLKRGINKFRFTSFIRNRALRILPLYLFILIMGFVLYPAISSYFNQDIHLPSIGYFLTFTQNFYFDYNASNKLIVFFLLITWSIAVEVQFYILLGFVLKFFKKYVLLFGILLVGIGVSFNLMGQINEQGHYFSTLTYFSDFGAGVIFAYYWFKKESGLSGQIIKNWYPILFFGAIILLFCWNSIFQNTPILFLSNLLFPFTFCLLVYHQMHPKINYFKPAQIKWVENLGEISYGLYLFHGAIITLFIFISKEMNLAIINGTGTYFSPILVLFLSVLCAKLSYRFLEFPFLKRK